MEVRSLQLLSMQLNMLYSPESKYSMLKKEKHWAQLVFLFGSSSWNWQAIPFSWTHHCWERLRTMHPLPWSCCQLQPWMGCWPCWAYAPERCPCELWAVPWPLRYRAPAWALGNFSLFWRSLVCALCIMLQQKGCQALKVGRKATFVWYCAKTCAMHVSYMHEATARYNNLHEIL